MNDKKLVETNDKKTKKSAAEIICNQAMLENTELKRYGQLKGHYFAGTRGARLIENTPLQPFFVKHIVSLKNQPVTLDNFTNYDESVRTTAGYYNITFVPKTDKRYVKNKPYVIGQDLVRLRVTVSGYQHWKKVAEKIPELGWIDQWCPILHERLFNLARKHPGMNFYFCPDWLAYADLIENRAKEQGLDLEHKPYVTWLCSAKQREEIEATHKMAPLKTREDYKHILSEIEMEDTVLDEIRENIKEGI